MLRFIILSLVITGQPAGQAALAAAGSTPELDLLRQVNQAFVEVAQRASASVVVINVVQKVAPPDFDDADDQDGTGGMPPGFWKNFHDQLKRRPLEKSVGQGSGIIIRTNGYILTNGHVIEDAETVKVRLQDGRVFKASVHGVDPQSDVAIIKIDAQNLPVAEWGDSALTRVGEFVTAIGAPFGFDYSVTFGHVSAKSRSNIIDGLEGISMDQDFIQTDALINPGNSGGPLVNIEGRVIGINTLIQGMHTGIGFAVPSNLAKEVSDQLIDTGKFMRPYLGIGMRAVREEAELRELITGVEDGVVVRQIVPGGPAAKSALQPSDIITSVDGLPVSTPQQLRGAIRSKKIGAPITLEVFRQGKTIPVKVSPSEWPSQPTLEAQAKTPSAPTAAPVELGITIKPLTAALATQFGAGMTQGVLIAAVEKNSPAARCGIKPGDIITSIDQQPIANRKQFQTALDKADVKKGVLVNLISGSTARFEILKAN